MSTGERADGSATKAEFDTIAAWTADAALGLGPDHHVPAGCRGSASPATLRWLLGRLDVRAGSRFLDAGAGVGGPAAFAAAETGVVPVLTDPEAGACAAAVRLFGLPAVRAGSRLPFADATFDVVWSLGVLDTADDQPLLLRELVRVLRPAGRLGLLIFVSTDSASSDRLPSNHFPTGEELDRLLADAGLEVVDTAPASSLGQPPPAWDDAMADVERVLERDHGADPAWTKAADQQVIIAELLGSGAVVGHLLVTRRS